MRDALGAFAVAVFLVTAPGAVPWMVRSQPARPVPTSSLTNVQAIGVSTAAATVYVATASGLYRASSAPYTSWTVMQTLEKQEALTSTIVSLAPDPRAPDDLLYVTAAGAVDRSTDGGRTATLATVGPLTNTVSAAVVVRAPSTPTTIYVGGSMDNGSVAVVYRSTDDGRTWAQVFPTAQAQGSMGVNTISALVVDARDATHVLAGGSGYHSGFLVESRNGGQTWQTLPGPAIFAASPAALAINPLRPTEMWASWLAMGVGPLEHSLDGGRTWRPVDVGLSPAPAHQQYQMSGGMHAVEVLTIQYDALSGRVYLVVEGVLQGWHPGPFAVYTTRAPAAGERGGPWEQFTPPGVAGGAWGEPLAIVPYGGYLVGSVSAGRTGHLVVRPLIGSNNWPVFAAFRGYYRRINGVQALGSPISPSRLCGGGVCQYFDKGRLEVRSPGHFAYGPLVSDLLAAQAVLPVGGTTSTVTYKALAALRGQRTAPPSGFRHGTAAVPGGRFIPSSPQLTAAPGYVVPAPFWQYMNRRDVAPDGWQQDVGLPLTRAVRATVTKGARGQRVIVLQAFQDAILTYDPRNAPAWRVERANIGLDYATMFPQAVR